MFSGGIGTEEEGEEYEEGAGDDEEAGIDEEDMEQAEEYEGEEPEHDEDAAYEDEGMLQSGTHGLTASNRCPEKPQKHRGGHAAARGIWQRGR